MLMFQVSLFVDSYLLHGSLTLQDVKELFFDEEDVRTVLVLYIEKFRFVFLGIRIPQTYS